MQNSEDPKRNTFPWQIHRDREGVSYCQGPGPGGGKIGQRLLNVYGVSLWADENVLEQENSTGCTTL